MSFQLDIVIPCKNSYSLKKYSIFYTIKIILAQKNVNYRLYVVDDMSNDDTFLHLKKDFSNIKNITFLENIHEGEVAAARNFGASKGVSPHILFIDDDTLLYDEYTLACTINNFGEYSFSCGATRLWTVMNWADYLFKVDTSKSLINLLRKISFCPKGIDRETGAIDLTHISFIGNYGLIKRNVFEKMNGFPIVYRGWGMEDTHLMYALCINNFDYGLFYEKDIKVYHLNHTIDKNQSFLKNYNLFRKYQLEVGVIFNEAAFFDHDHSSRPVLKDVNF